jgi:hypothetical protein
MDIKRILLIAIGVIVLSFFYFPVILSAFPISNTKNLMAAIGFIIVALEICRKRNTLLNRDLLIITIWAILVSLAGLISVAYNETPDYAYATYIRTFLIWFLAANCAVYIIKKIHGKIGVKLICNYLVLICVLQCISVLLIDTYPDFKGWVDRTFLGNSYAGTINRLYGIGASLDIGGSRFAVVLLLIANMLTLDFVKRNTKWMYMYIFAFIFILVVGSMVGRTTSIGGGIALLYVLWSNKGAISSEKNRKFILALLMLIFVGLVVCVYHYNHNTAFRENVRFAFEGFFNWWELGEWQTTSTDRLQTMIIWPDNAKTWIIGDAYFDGPSDIDPYYVGPPNPGFYKWTDIGYLRFIFYFGLVGLGLFIAYFIKVAATCSSRFNGYRKMFLLLLFFNFVLWFRVSTDVFLVFALFLCISKEENEVAEKRLEVKG